MDIIRKKLVQLQSSTDTTSKLWKPQSGKQQIRIVPYKFNPENPFIELYFHYGMTDGGGRRRSYLSPISFGRPDPIEEFATKLKDSGNKESFQLGMKIGSKMRTFVPVIVRGEENEGVKFWGFGKTVYQELIAIIDDPDYGDITDPVNGRDVTVEFHTAEETGKNFPSTTIRVKPNITIVSEDPTVLESIKNTQVKITDVYREKSYDELEDILQEYLNPGDESNSDATKATADTTTKTSTLVSDTKDAFDELFDK